MHSRLAAAALLSALVAGSGNALAQTQGNTAPPAVRTDDGRTSGTPVPGSNSFTEGQARGRMEDAGFANVTDLQKDDQGIWRGRATRGGSPTNVALDYQGNVFGGASAGSASGSVTPRDGTAAGRVTDRALGANTTGANPGGGRPDGTPGNPPSTAAGRAVDRAQGQTPQADGTPGNPPGTAAGRAADRALGTTNNPGAGGPAR